MSKNKTQDNVNFEDSSKVILEEKDLLQLNVNLAKVNVFRVDAQNLEKDIQNKSLLIDNLKMKIEALKTEMKYITEFIQNKKTKHKDALAKYEEFVKYINNKYGLTPGWGFDEDSGEIMTTEERQEQLKLVKNE